VGAIADAMEAHDQAYFNAHVLHRDISAGNILLGEKGKGLLIDWDLCIRVDPDNCNRLISRRRPDRTGTWQFMSVELLQDSTKVNELADDRESCFYVLVWTALWFTKHTIKKGSLKSLLSPFDERYEYGDVVAGGRLKRDSLIQKEIEKSVEFNDRPHLDKLIADLTDVLAVRYEPPPSASYMKPATYEDLLSHRNTRMETLKKRDWLVKTFRRHLDAVLGQPQTLLKSSPPLMTDGSV